MIKEFIVGFALLSIITGTFVLLWVLFNYFMKKFFGLDDIESNGLIMFCIIILTLLLFFGSIRIGEFLLR